ncbi:MAG: organomercurial lyase, partial [Nocardioidaceae bacterium]
MPSTQPYDDHEALVRAVSPTRVEVSEAARQARLPPAVRSLHREVLSYFLQSGHGPGWEWLRGRASGLDLEPQQAVGMLEVADLMHRDHHDDVVVVAYPFSGVQTRHRVELDGTAPVWAMCAVDALGIPLMTGHDGVIESADPTSGEPVRIGFADGRWSWSPDSTIVLSARGGEAGPSSCCSCPHINFHTHPDHARAYLADHPALAGLMLD